MRILYAANYSLKNCGERYDHVVLKLQQGFSANGHYVYPFSVNDMERLSGPLGHRFLSKRHVNKALIKTCRSICPDILFIVHGKQISAETLVEIKSDNPLIKIILFWGDAIWEGANNLDTIHNKLPFLDSLFITTGGPLLEQYADPSRLVAYVPNPVDINIDRNKAFENDNYKYDLIFIGRDDPERNKILTTIRSELPKIKLGFFGCLGAPLVFGSDKEEIMAQSKMALNLTRRNDIHLCTSNRLSDTMANGVLNFIDDATGIKEMFNDKEAVYYSSIEDLIHKVDYYHKNDAERRLLAKNGLMKIHKSLSATQITKFMIDMTIEYNDNYEITWPRHIYQKNKNK